jgi:carboxyl-terminal processing protease
MHKPALPQRLARLAVLAGSLAVVQVNGWAAPPSAQASATVAAATGSSSSGRPVAYRPLDGSTAIGRLLHLVRTEYMVEVPSGRLLDGARRGLRDYIAKHNPSVHLPAQASDKSTSFAEFKTFYESFAGGHPEVDGRALAQACMRGILEVLDDPYTVYLDQDEYKSLQSQLNGGNFGGLGIYIELDDKNGKALTVVEPMEGTPAMKAGIKAHDVLVEIGGVSTKGLSIDEASKLLRGKVGSSVTLTVRRAGVPELMHIAVQRAVIRIKTLTYRVVDNHIGEIRLRVFGENTNEEFDEAFRAFDQAGVRGYVLDLRNNGGGYINAALDVVSHFVPTGSKVVTVAERGTPELVYTSRPNLRDVFPLVVLVNKYSASASEITAGAVKDLHGGTLLGEKSFGKGSVQKIFPLPEGSAVKITSAHYRTPSGQDIHKKGIVPDLVIPMKLEEVGSSNDSQMKAALELVGQRVASYRSRPAELQAVPVDVTVVASSAEEFRRIDEMCAHSPDKLAVAEQRLVVEGEHYIDEVTLRSAAGASRVVRFLVRFIERP